jgi:hypothetical protein
MSIETLPRGMYPAVLDDVAKHRFTVFTQGDYNFNIIGVRNLDSSSVNRFDDTIYVCWKVGFEWKMFKAPITTDPGRYWLEKPDYKPCAVMYHNQQVRSAYKFGLHRGSYKALVQAKPIKYWRDGNKDAHIDYTGTIYNDIIGLNIHRASTRQDGRVSGVPKK